MNRCAWLLGVLAALAAGCAGYRESYDREADRLPAALKAAERLHSSKKVLITTNVTRRIGYRLGGPVSAKEDWLGELAYRTVRRMKTFEKANISATEAHPDRHFIFNVEIASTQEPGLFSGIIFPFYRSRSYTVSLAVLDEKGKPLGNYTAAAETFLIRNTFLILCTPFYWPGWSEARGERNPFEAIAVKLLADRKRLM